MKITDYSRIEGAVDVRLLQNMHLIGIGSGGAFSFYENMVRSGVRKLTVLDIDNVDETNIVRQGFFPDQIGQPKVEALEDHLRKLNPDIEFTGITKNFLEMSREEQDAVFGDADIFCFFTDSFPAQSAGNLLALRYGKPAIWAGFYEKSQCAEIVFWIPGVTPACFRCAVSPRYVAQANAPEEIKASSHLNTFSHCQLLDGFCGLLVKAILHNDTQGFEFSNWFGKSWDRNLIQFKIHPDHSNQEGNLFQRILLPTGGRAFTFNTLWLKIEPDKPPKYPQCPDCGGDGRLLHPVESFNLKPRRA